MPRASMRRAQNNAIFQLLSSPQKNPLPPAAEGGLRFAERTKSKEKQEKAEKGRNNRGKQKKIPVSVHSTISSVPTARKTQPAADLILIGSPKNTKASTSVSTTLILSTGTTLDASPSCSAR